MARNIFSKIRKTRSIFIKKIILAFFLSFITACVTVPVKQTLQRPIFANDEYLALAASGNGIVEGQGFLKTIGGDVITSAGEEVRLNPITSYSKFWYENAYLKGHPLSNFDPRYEKYQFTTVADGDGKFKFIDIPPGNFYIVTQVMWQSATGYRGSLENQGGLVVKVIEVKNDETTRIIVTR